MEKTEMKDLGWANGWYMGGGGKPDAVTECEEKRHHLSETSIGRCQSVYRCDECGYFYRVDSSD